MDKKLMPGCQTTKELWAVNWDRVYRYMENKVIPFLKLLPNAVCLDVGEANPRMDFMRKKLDLNVEQFAPENLNFDSVDRFNYYDVIFCFDLLEHIQNPLWLMGQLKLAVKPSGSIYVNMPENPRWLWGEEHFFEMPYKHFIKWIVDPLELRVVRQKKIFFIANWKAFFIGIRPLLRVLRGETTWKSMARSMFCVKFRIYELRKD